MRRAKATQGELADLRRIPGIGPSLAQDLYDLGFRRVSGLRNRNPELLYRKLCKLRGAHQDRCVLYTFRCAVYFATETDHDPELLKWWNWQDAKIAKTAQPRSKTARRSAVKESKSPRAARGGQTTNGQTTSGEFRRLALALPGAVESAHMNHPDFRVGGKVFASLGSNEDWGMVKLATDEQRTFLAASPNAFSAATGAWGRRGCTMIQLAAADKTLVRQALWAAWRNTAPGRIARKS